MKAATLPFRTLRTRFLGLAMILLASMALSACDDREQVDSETLTMQVYKSPTCGCCGDWVSHIEDAGFAVEVTDTEEMAAVKSRLGLNPNYQSCHTATIGEYVFEGHIPASVIQRFLEEQPDALGLAVPGMPVGSPGMEMGQRFDPYDVLVISRDGSSEVYQHIATPEDQG